MNELQVLKDEGKYSKSRSSKQQLSAVHSNLQINDVISERYVDQHRQSQQEALSHHSTLEEKIKNQAADSPNFANQSLIQGGNSNRSRNMNQNGSTSAFGNKKSQNFVGEYEQNNNAFGGSSSKKELVSDQSGYVEQTSVQYQAYNDYRDQIDHGHPANTISGSSLPKMKAFVSSNNDTMNTHG